MNRLINVRTRCVSCDRTGILQVSAEGFDRWQKGQLIQDALPELSPAQRELLISGMCGKCFDKLLGENEQ